MKVLHLLKLTSCHHMSPGRLCLTSTRSYLYPANIQGTMRHFHSSIKGNPENIPERYENTRFKTVYFFPYIRHARLLSRLKIYQTALTIVAIPAFGVMYSFGSVGKQVITASVSVAAFAGVMLYTMSSLIRRFTGIIAVSEDCSTVRFSHLTFWGRRSDVYVPIENIVPLADYCTNIKDIYIPLKTYSSKDVLYMSLKWGEILERDLFEKIFGDISYLSNR